MPLSRNRLYLFLAISCMAGYTWLYIGAISSPGQAGVCIIKHTTGVPCPSCGSTRSVLSLLDGNISGSLLWNPFGIILFLLMTGLPIWIAYDFVSRKNTLFDFYKKAELTFKRKEVAIPAIVLVLANWIWNIYKGL